MTIPIEEAIDVWQVSHALLLSMQNVRTGGGGKEGTGIGSSTDMIDWSASVRKLAPEDPQEAPDGFTLRVMDSVYGDVATSQDLRVRSAAYRMIKRFKQRLESAPDVFKDYGKMRMIVHG
jgi:hypothetical protein